MTSLNFKIENDTVVIYDENTSRHELTLDPFNKYNNFEVLASGANGTAIKARHKILGRFDIIKIYHKTNNHKAMLEAVKNSTSNLSGIIATVNDAGIYSGSPGFHYSIMHSIEPAITLENYAKYKEFILNFNDEYLKKATPSSSENSSPELDIKGFSEFYNLNIRPKKVRKIIDKNKINEHFDQNTGSISEPINLSLKDIGYIEYDKLGLFPKSYSSINTHSSKYTLLESAIKIAFATYSALSKIHDHQIIHGDFHEGNILLKNSTWHNNDIKMSIIIDESNNLPEFDLDSESNQFQAKIIDLGTSLAEGTNKIVSLQREIFHSLRTFDIIFEGIIPKLSDCFSLHTLQPFSFDSAILYPKNYLIKFNKWHKLPDEVAVCINYQKLTSDLIKLCEFLCLLGGIGYYKVQIDAHNIAQFNEIFSKTTYINWPIVFFKLSNVPQNNLFIDDFSNLFSNLLVAQNGVSVDDRMCEVEYLCFDLDHHGQFNTEIKHNSLRLPTPRGMEKGYCTNQVTLLPHNYRISRIKHPRQHKEKTFNLDISFINKFWVSFFNGLLHADPSAYKTQEDVLCMKNNKIGSKNSTAHAEKIFTFFDDTIYK